MCHLVAPLGKFFYSYRQLVLVIVTTLINLLSWATLASLCAFLYPSWFCFLRVLLS